MLTLFVLTRASDLKNIPTASLSWQYIISIIIIKSLTLIVIGNTSVSFMLYFLQLLMNAHAIDFRDRSGQFEKWKLPEQVIDFDLININQEILSDLNNIVAVYKNDIPTASTAKPFNSGDDIEKNKHPKIISKYMCSAMKLIYLITFFCYFFIILFSI
jgi:hypothetical protein